MQIFRNRNERYQNGGLLQKVEVISRNKYTCILSYKCWCIKKLCSRNSRRSFFAFKGLCCLVATLNSTVHSSKMHAYFTFNEIKKVLFFSKHRKQTSYVSSSNSLKRLRN